MTRRSCIALLAGEAACVRIVRPPLARAAAYLWSQQAEDGGWHSHTYGLLRSGQSLTPFVLGALLEVPPSIYAVPAAKVDRAIAFIRSHTGAGGALGMADASIPDYPNYATALAVSALCRARRLGREAAVGRMVAYLRAQQFTEQNGWHPQDSAYGAWGMGGYRRTPPDTGHVDLSMTRYVLEALHAAGLAASDPAFQCARVFVDRCQNFNPSCPAGSDGGFFFSTTEFDTNKAGHDGKHFRSYGTTTADGILALLATGREPAGARVAAAGQWLTSHHREMFVPGFAGEAYDRWPRGLAFYYAAACARAFRSLNLGTPPRVAGNLMRMQRPDGSWANPENLVKEDDPLIATVFAVGALTAASTVKR